MKPLIALHKDADGNILNAGSFDYSHHLDTWMRSLDVQSGDTITFGDKAQRKVADDVSSVDPLAIAPAGSKPAKMSA